ncbi:protein BIC1-like [Andrographis paniculata]|uniref:protein BIC1-like n=1 Tax=Andrographis paniculata TaxID=175694 RepID=UPI0021E730FB|nr:protein BIC1-like [Andrographis paniculata]
MAPKKNPTIETLPPKILPSESPPKMHSTISALTAHTAGEGTVDDAAAGVRERLRRHQTEVAAGRVWIPEIWGEEDFLKDWIDCSAFDAALAATPILSAREALVEEGRRTRANSGAGIRVESSGRRRR